MAILKIDPPPNTSDVTVLRNYISDLYDTLVNVIYNLDSDNMSEDFLNSLSAIQSESEGETV